YAGLLPPRAGALRRGHGHETVARHAQEPQVAQAARALPRRQDQALLQARHRAPRRAIPPEPGVIGLQRPELGEAYLSAAEIGARVAELGEQIGSDYAGRDPLLVGLLKASIVFLADLSRAMPILHRVDFVELEGYDGQGTGGLRGIRLLKDLDEDICGQDVLLVEDVVDTGLTLHALTRILEVREPRSLAAVTLLDRPY